MKSTSGIAGAMSKSSLEIQFPARPGHGTIGKQIVVYANYFRLNTPKDLTLTRYNVEIAPEVKGKKLARIFELLLEMQEFKFVVTDWKSMVVSKTPLNIPADFVTQITYRAEGQDEPLERAITYKIRVVTPTTLAVGEFVKHLSATSSSGPQFLSGLEVIQGLNALLGHQAKQDAGVVSIGQNRHFATDHSQGNAHNIRVLGGGLEAIRGYFQSARPATGGILLNINVTHGVFFQPIRLDMMYRERTYPASVYPASI